MVFLTVFIDILAATISTPVMPFYAKEFGATNTQIGYLFAAWSFCSTFFAPILGRLSDRYGRRPILITALIGAGVANIGQGLSLYSISLVGASAAFYVFGFFRAFSGVWAAIGTVTNVYLADVVPKSLLPDYTARMSIVGPLAFTFGPGMGGGLAAIGGYNVPVLVDGILTMFSAFLVAANLPETPAFEQLREERKLRSGGVDNKADLNVPKPPLQVYVLATAAFCGGLTMSAGVSMQAIFLNSVYDLDVLHVTYVSVGTAVSLVLTGILISRRLKDIFGLTWTIVVCNTLGFFLYIGMAYCGQERVSIWCFLTCLWLNAVQSAASGACTGPLLNEYTETANRGKIMSISQLAMNSGRMVGPMMYGHIADYDINIVWVIAGVALLVKAFLTSFVRVKTHAPLERTQSLYGNEWQDEKGTHEDVLAIGKYTSQLLEKGHYKWVSRRSEIETLLERLLPPLDTSNAEVYKEHISMLEMSVAMAQRQSAN
eukprot:TRINITY_DN23338_c0_g1_i1.p1 TRINITY_DN23338_c0_g1~~TRINITY_DN23338_c0_g1_i1.p1  ORF type:complete len:529 (-),score=57.33 TRINITY_DN23338_c0_g1_i1:149-1609(-)